MEKIVVIGAGLMGHGIGQIFAANGHPVVLVDIKAEVLEQAKRNIRNNLEILAENDLVQKERIDSIMETISTTTDVKKGVVNADFVFESALENLNVKQQIFSMLDEICPPHVILATNTSVLSITEIAAKAKNRDRIVGSHFWNPPYLIPLVEVVPGEETSPMVLDRIFHLLAKVGKHPVKIKKDIPGFVANRMQHALWREAISIVENDIADASTVDECVKYSFGMRLPVLGPLENADMVGTDLTLAIHDYLFKYLESSSQSSQLLKSLVEKKDLGFKTGRGFQSWSDDQMASVQKKLQKHLINTLKTKGSIPH